MVLSSLGFITTTSTNDSECVRARKREKETETETDRQKQTSESHWLEICTLEQPVDPILRQWDRVPKLHTPELVNSESRLVVLVDLKLRIGVATISYVSNTNTVTEGHRTHSHQNSCLRERISCLRE